MPQSQVFQKDATVIMRADAITLARGYAPGDFAMNSILRADQVCLLNCCTAQNMRQAAGHKGCWRHLHNSK